jgi:hypothetical protein
MVRMYRFMMMALAASVPAPVAQAEAAWAQAPGTPAGEAQAPVTQAEAAAAMDRAEAIVRRVLGLPEAALRPAPPASDAPATRSGIVRDFGRLFRLAEPRFVFTPRPQRFDAARLRRLPAASDQAQLERLVRWGAVAPYGPLATNPGGLSPEEFGDALGFLVARIAELTHTPDARFSPGLMRD